ncbi:MAG: hypothetical protein ACHQ53_02145 [Polyangiales bacterium]
MRANRAAVVWLCSLCACGGSRSAASGAGALETIRYEVAATPRAVTGGGDRAAIEQAISRAAAEAGGELHGDGRLAVLAQRVAAGESNDRRTLEAAARGLGLVDAGLTETQVRVSSAELLAAAIGGELSVAARQTGATHFGVFATENGRAAFIVLGRRPLLLDPVPRRTPLGTTFVLRGRLDATTSNPKLAVSGPDTQLLLPAGAGPDFELRVSPRKAGVYRLELRALRAGHVQNQAELLVYVGAADDERNASNPSPPALDADRTRDALYTRAAELRAEHDLPKLAVDPTLELHAANAAAAIAAGDTGEGAVPGASEGPAPSVARGAESGALFAQLLGDGALRARLLGTEITHMGIGVSRAGRELVAVALTGHIDRNVDPELAPARLLSALNESRRQRGAPGLRPDDQLTASARRAAAEIGRHPAQGTREVLRSAEQELERLRLAFARVTTLAALVVDPSEAATLEPALDPAVQAAGIAVAECAGTAGQPARFAVVVALGWTK